MADDAFNGLYKKYNDTLYVHTTSTRNLILKYGYDDGWNGCHGNETLIDPGCFPYRRWAYIADLSAPITGTVNPWSKTGDSSGFIPCGKYIISCVLVNFIIVFISKYIWKLYFPLYSKMSI